MPDPTNDRDERDDVAELDLAGLPAPPRGERRATLALMLVTALCALAVAFALRGEAMFALVPGTPSELGDLAKLKPHAGHANTYVHATGLLGTAGAVRYGRPAEGDSFRLAPVAGNPLVWVEIRVPEGFEGPRFVPPTSFAGRLVPLREAGLRHARLAETVRKHTGTIVPDDALVLIDGSSPRASRWALGLVALFVAFAGWNLVSAVRIVRRVRDDRSASSASGTGTPAAPAPAK